MQPESDELLLERIRVGNRDALSHLYQRYHGRLFAFCYRLLKNTAHAEDAVQDTFVKICSSVHSLEKSKALRSWMFQIARNEALMKLRRNKESSNGGMDDVWDDNTPLTVLEHNDIIGIVERSVNNLKVEYREVLLLREYDQLSYAEIADITGATTSAVKSRIFKARKALAETLGPWFKERAE